MTPNPVQVLGSARRRSILRLVWNEARSAGEIHRALGDVTFGAISQQLALLRDAGLVERRVEGRHRVYTARKEGLGALTAWLEEMWSDALAELKLRAEMEAGRRGPRPRRRRGATRAHGGRR